MAKKMTIVEQYNAIISKVEGILTDAEIAFLKERAEMHSKKNASRGMTATQKANLEILDTIREILAEKDEAVTISDLIKEEPLNTYTNQKISALMKKLVDGGEVEKTSIKKVSYFRIKQ